MCPYVGPSVRWLVRPSASRSVGPSVNYSDWLFDRVLDQQQKYSIPCVSFTTKVFSRTVATIKASVHTLVHPSGRRSVRWFVSDGFVMILLLGDVWPWTYGRMAGEVCGLDPPSKIITFIFS